MLTGTPPTLWRVKMRSSLPRVDHRAALRRCRDKGIVGLGWYLDGERSSGNADRIVTAIRTSPLDGYGPRAANVVRMIACDAQEGDVVWTRDLDGRYWVGRITGPFRYGGSKAAWSHDLHQTRPVAWAPRTLDELETPGDVIRAFTGIGQSICRIPSDTARRISIPILERLSGRAPEPIELTHAEVLEQLLSAEDVEDLIYVWMQVEGNYVALPRTRKRDTPGHEYPMRHRVTGRRGIVQVKTGSARVDLDALRGAGGGNSDLFAYATSGGYDGDRAGVTVLDTDRLVRFMRDQPQLTPARVGALFDLVRVI